jgi:hypothetical protein
MLKRVIKRAFHVAGYKIERRDLLEETIPGSYNRSPFLPRLYRGYLDRVLYFEDQLKTVQKVPGDIVECGVSIGHGALLFMLLSEYIGVQRHYYGFDSFEGFPEPVEEDEETPIVGENFYASPPETVIKVLRDGRIPEDTIRSRVHLAKGLFTDTLPRYKGVIALLHLDCDLYESYKAALENLYDLVSEDGIIMFDEYRDTDWPGATKAIDEFFADKPEEIRPHEKCDWKYYVRKT